MIALAYGIYGGYLLMTSAGNDEQVEDGKKTLITASLGVLLAVSSYSITNFVTDYGLRATDPFCESSQEWCEGGEVEADKGLTCNKYSVRNTGRTGVCVDKSKDCFRGRLRTQSAKNGKKGVFNCSPKEFCCMGMSSADEGSTGLEEDEEWKNWGTSDPD
jgi:hypothetical protein